MSQFTHKRVNRRSVLKGAAATGLGLGVASSIYLPTAFAAQDAAPITFWTAHSGLGFDALTKISEQYNAMQSNYVVEIVQRPPGSETDVAGLITAVRSGEGPDVYLLDRFTVGERGASGLLEDLKPLMEAAGDDTDLSQTFAGFAAEEAQYDGGIYAMPFDTDLRALFYNKKMIEEAGADMAAWDKANGPMTFDSISEFLLSMNVEENGALTQAGFVPYFSQGWHYTYGFAWGGDFFDYENCTVSPDSEINLEAFQWVQDYCETAGFQKLYDFRQPSARPGAAPTDNPFIQGRLGAMISGNWEFAGFANYAPDTEYDFTFTPIPNEGDPSITWAGGWSAVVPAGANNVEGGYDFAKYMTSAEGQRTYVEINNNLPTNLALLDDVELLGENLAWFAQQMGTTRNRPVLPVGAKYWDEMTAAWERIYTGDASPADAMATARENTMMDMDAGGYCPIAPPK
ncbi:MAG: ABC transporter substrate-binding protein [Thermomicrobiales bacterium]|nr:ABC transporter substrate-binding protein [Thermomicrobiales bacterium]